MSELSILELETESAELLPARETLGIHNSFNFGGNHVNSVQVAVTHVSHSHAQTINADATNILIVG
jgi:hypothetical protein